MSPNSSSLSILLSQFQSRYPMGSLTAELLTVQAETYVVRALVQVGGMVLATGMAAAGTIEQAEDQAKIRALEAMGTLLTMASPQISSLLSPPSSHDEVQLISHQPSPANYPTAVELPFNPSDMIAPLPPSPPNQVEPDQTATPQITPPQPSPTGIADTVVADWYTHINLDDDLTSSFSTAIAPPSISPLEEPPAELAENEIAPPPASPQRNGKLLSKKSTPQHEHTPPINSSTSSSISSSASSSTSGSTDLSDVIAQTDVELARLGWTKIQGREHLKRTYGKRSRQELNETELYDFLHYLEAQP